MQAGLYVVATPLGNLGDLSARAQEVLAGVDLIACEDTRRSAPLLAHFAIDTPLVAYHEHAEERVRAKLSRRLGESGAVALISDAGTPLISDPGYRLVQAAHEQGATVIPIPGPCAVTAALSVAGLATDRFRFEGFLPAAAGARQRRLATLADETATLVFYEAPHRVLASLVDMVAAFGGERPATLARELTKTFETVRRASLAQLQQWVAGDTDQQRGEIVLLVEGSREQLLEVDAATLRLMTAMAESIHPRQAAALLADYTGLRKNQIYQAWLARDTQG